MIRQLAVERDVEGKARNEGEQRLEPEAGARRGRDGDRVAHGAGMQLVKAIPLFRTGVGASLRGRLFRGHHLDAADQGDWDHDGGPARFIGLFGRLHRQRTPRTRTRSHPNRELFQIRQSHPAD
jgi:hypothetical protein